MKIDWLFLVSIVVVCNLLGAIGGLWAGGDSDWYRGLKKSSLNPPSWVFAPMWTFLFTLMGIAFYFILKAPDSRLKTIGIVLFALQFVLNILWSYFFFGLQNPLFAFIDIVGLITMIIATGVVFYLVKPVSGYLFIPYLLWVGFASLLNFRILILN